MKRYRVDIYDRNFVFKDMGQTSSPKVVVDYLVLEKSSCVIPKKINARRGDFGVVRGDDILFYGIVVDYEYDGKTSTITFEQLTKLLDVEVFADANELTTKTIEQWMSDNLRQVYDGSDSFQNLTGMTITQSSSTMGMYNYSDDGIYNLYDLTVHFFKTYGVICDISLNIVTKKVLFNFRQVTVSVWKLETKVADVLDYTIKASTETENPNKMIFENELDRSQSITYYWHPTEFSGTVDTDGTVNRVVPVVSRCAIVQPQDEQLDSENNVVQEAKTFEQVAYEEAVNTMYQSKYDDQIEITFNTESKLIDIGVIGQLYVIIDGDNQYPTMLTGYQRLNDKHTLMTFGYVRTRLTQILKIERRKK